jgi:hypothetical protein
MDCPDLPEVPSPHQPPVMPAEDPLDLIANPLTTRHCFLTSPSGLHLGLDGGEGIRAVAGLRLVASPGVLSGVLLGLVHHPLDVVLGQRGPAGHAHPTARCPCRGPWPQPARRLGHRKQLMALAISGSQRQNSVRNYLASPCYRFSRQSFDLSTLPRNSRALAAASMAHLYADLQSGPRRGCPRRVM